MLGAQEDATQIDCNQALKVLIGVVFEDHTETGRRYANVVVDDVELSELVDGHIEHADDIVFQRHIDANGNSRATGLLDQTDRLFGAVDIEVGASDPRAFLGETGCRGPANAGPGTGDDGVLAFKPHQINFSRAR